MDLPANGWKPQVTQSIAAPSVPSVVECGRRDSLVGSPFPPSEQLDPTQCSDTTGITYNWNGAGSPQRAASGPEGVANDLEMPSSACLDTRQPSPGSPCSSASLSSPGPEGKPEDAGSTGHSKLLQEAGKYNAWEPLLRGVLPPQGPSSLWGQICFDVTTEEQRGFWLLPEEVLAHQGELAAEEHEDRQLFTNTPVSEEEQQAIEQVLLQLLEIQQQDDVLKTGEQESNTLLVVQPVWLEQLVLRYLYSCSFDKQKTVDLLQSTLTFRTQHLPVLESEVYSELRNMGACYWHGRDRKMRPLLVVSLQRLQQLQREAGEEKVTRIVVFCLEFFLRHLCVAGAVESWCILCDLNGTSISSFPLPLLLKLMQLIQGAYRGRLYRFYILYAPRLFHFVAKPLVSSLPATTAKKIRVYTQLDDWHQERRAQFAAHQLEKKFGGTAVDITENWYPFRFYPGPFDPEASSDSIGGSSAAIRWESEKALHARVHPSVHIGASLHTSLLQKRMAAQQDVDADRGERPILRYAAWLHCLPELSLSPATIHWATKVLRHRLQGPHESLVQHLRGSGQEESSAGQSPGLSASGASEAPTTAAVILSPKSFYAGGISRVVSPLLEPSPSPPVGLTSASPEGASASSFPLSPESGRQLAGSPSLERPVKMALPQGLSSSLHDDAAAASPSEAEQVLSVLRKGRATKDTTSGLDEPYEPNWETPLCRTARPVSGPEGQNVRGSPQYSVAHLGASQHSGCGIVPTELSPLSSGLRGEATHEGLRAGPQHVSEGRRLKDFCEQEHQPNRRGFSSLSSLPSRGQPDAVRGRASAHVRAYWALESSLVSPPASQEPTETPIPEPAVPMPNATADSVGAKNLRKLFAMDAKREFAGCAGEARTGLGLQSDNCWSVEAQKGEQPAMLAPFQPAGRTALRHPQTPLARSLGGPCRTSSLSAAGATEGALGSPPAAAWQEAPACERTPSWRDSGCFSFTVPEREPLRVPCPTERLGCAIPITSTQLENQPRASSVAADATAGPECGAVQLSAYYAFDCRVLSRSRPLEANARIHEQRISQFVPPVTADPSPSISIYSVTGSSPSGSCLGCSDNPEGQRGSIVGTAPSPLPDGSAQLREATDMGCCVSTSPLYLSGPVEALRERPDGNAEMQAGLPASRVMELRRLRRMVRALCESVSGSYNRSEQDLLDPCDSATVATRSRRLHGRYARKQQQPEKVHEADEQETEVRSYVGMRRRLSGRLLSRTRPSVVSPTGASAAPKPAIKRRSYRRLRLYRRRCEARAKPRFAFRGNKLPGSKSGCKLFVEAPRSTRTGATLSRVRGTSKRLIRLPISLSDRVRRGTLVLARRMQGKGRGSGTI